MGKLESWDRKLSLNLSFDPEDGRKSFIQNSGLHVENAHFPYPRRQYISVSRLSASGFIFEYGTPCILSANTWIASFV
jgi:hypothetical protein